MDERHDKHPTRAGARQWLGLAVLLLPTMLLTADLGVLWLATPDLTADLRPSGTEFLWITDVYGFMTAGFLVVMGTLGDRVGRRRLLLAGAALYLLVEFLMLTAAAESSPALLIGSRALLGVAGAAILPSTLSLISAMFTDPGQRTRAISLWSTALALGVGLGPVFGGLLLSQLWWGWVFLLGAPVMVVVLAAGRSVLPEFRDASAGRLDVPSVLLFLLGVLPVVYAIKQIAEHGRHAPVVAVGVAGLVFGWLFVRRQRRIAAPLLDLRLFADRTFSAALAILFLGMMALNSVEYLVPPFLQMVGGLSPMAGGLWLLPSAAAFLLGAQLTPPLARHVGPARVLVAGTLVSLVGYALAAQAAGPVAAAAAITVIMFGVGPISVLGTDLAVAAAPAEKAGSAAAAGQTAYDLGLAMGIAITGSVATAVYRDQVASGIPAGTPAGAEEAAHDTLGGAISAAENLPAPLAGRLTDAARDAFVSGFHAAAMVAAALAVVVIVVALTALRRRSTVTVDAPGPEAPERADAAPAAR
ncbi:MFS transporter [Actinomadura algeriensis]|uniref:DHA2 family multidrug resistance protein-like MFS transporter n=1 Tax=Actinomadura algeriensis TaxID=1679523 RepID=A0ABR9JRI3_9ACTN|nr:MFS transporter [Actinomadura algeriensis]MBE1533179.1 DHA2 family multidrug resistance protein-like MFS transporter [Actinomadura algeriensis]